MNALRTIVPALTWIACVLGGGLLLFHYRPHPDCYLQDLLAMRGSHRGLAAFESLHAWAGAATGALALAAACLPRVRTGARLAYLAVAGLVAYAWTTGAVLGPDVTQEVIQTPLPSEQRLQATYWTHVLVLPVLVTLALAGPVAGGLRALRRRGSSAACEPGATAGTPRR